MSAGSTVGCELGRSIQDPRGPGTAQRARVTVDARMVGAAGIGTYLQNLLPLIIAARPEWQFDLLGRPDELAEFAWARAERVSLIPCAAPIYGLTEQIQLARRIPSGTDLVWSPHYNIPLGYRGALVVTVHDLCHLALPDLIKGPHRRAYARAMFRAIRRRASRVLCDSEFTKGELRRLAGWGGKEPVTAHLGVNPRWFQIEPAARPHPKPFILFVGTVKPHKNLVTLIKAFETLAPSIPHDLLIVGKTSGLITGDDCVVRAAASLEGRIRLTGEVPQKTLEQFFVHADAFVFPSFYEGFGLPPLEAMACGCPTVVSRAGSLPEVCGDASLYFDPTDPRKLAAAILQVLSSPELRQRLREQGRSHAARFSWHCCAETTLGVFQELVPA